MKHFFFVLFQCTKIETDFWNVQEEIIGGFVEIKVPILNVKGIPAVFGICKL